MSRSPRPSLSRRTASALPDSPISKTTSSAGPGAPPCSGPLSAPTAPATAETRSDRVEMMILAAKVEAFMPWSETALR